MFIQVQAGLVGLTLAAAIFLLDSFQGSSPRLRAELFRLANLRPPIFGSLGAILISGIALILLQPAPSGGSLPAIPGLLNLFGWVVGSGVATLALLARFLQRMIPLLDPVRRYQVERNLEERIVRESAAAFIRRISQ